MSLLHGEFEPRRLRFTGPDLMENEVTIDDPAFLQPDRPMSAIGG